MDWLVRRSFCVAPNKGENEPTDIRSFPPREKLHDRKIVAPERKQTETGIIVDWFAKPRKTYLQTLIVVPANKFLGFLFAYKSN